MIEGLKVLINLEQSPLEGNVAYQLPSSAVLSALLPRLLNLQSCWNLFARCAGLALCHIASLEQNIAQEASQGRGTL